MPALLTRMDTGPWALFDIADDCFDVRLEPDVELNPLPAHPREEIVCNRASARLGGRGAHDGRAAAAEHQAMALPMPREAPVTRATCPLRSIRLPSRVELRLQRRPVGKRQALKALCDALGERSEDFAGAAFEYMGHAPAAISLTHSTSARDGQPGHERFAYAAQIATAFGIDVVDDGNSRRLTAILESASPSRPQPEPSRGMERSADRKRERALGAARLGAFHCAFHAPACPAITTCEGALKFTASQTSAPAASAHTHDLVVLQAENRRHRALSVRHSFLHRLRAQAHQREAVGERNRARRDERGVFAELCPRAARARLREVEPQLQAQMPAVTIHGLRVHRAAQFFRGTGRS